MPILRNAVRNLRTAPVASIVAILSLALGIGATTGMFSILDALLLRSLPVREPDRLVQVGLGSRQTSLTNPLWEQIRDRGPAFADGALAWGTTRFDLSSGGESDPVLGLFTSGSFFDVLGVAALRGRMYSTGDDRRGGGTAGAVAVVSYAFWQRRLGGAEDVVGRTLTLNRVAFTIVGVAPARFTGLDVGTSFDVAVPIGTEPLIRGRDSSLDQRTHWWLNVFLRLREDETPEQATALLARHHDAIRETTMPHDLRSEDLKSYLRDPFILVPAASGTSSLRDRYARPLEILMGVVSLVLLIACANIANLQLARAAARQGELGLRLALGASRLHLAKQLFGESLLLALLGAAGGLAVAQWGSRLLVHQLSTQSTTVFLDVSIDWRMLAFTAAVGVLTAILFGTVPAWRAGRVHAGEVLTPQTRNPAAESPRRLASVLLIAQVALSLVLVAVAGLFLRSFSALASRDLGFNREGVLIASVSAQRSTAAPEARADLFEQVLAALVRVPGTRSVAASFVTPVSGSTWQYRIEVPDRPDLPASSRGVHVNLISPGWFRTYGTAFVAGRDFSDADSASAVEVAIVNEALAQRIFGGDSPIGRMVVQPGRPGSPARSMQIVGLVRDAVYRSLRAEVPPTLYIPLAQRRDPWPAISYSVRVATVSPPALTKTVASAITAVDPNLAITFRTLGDQVNATLVQERLLAMLSGFFGAFALVLAGLGLYGVTAYHVSRQRAEIGIRMALGATPIGVQSRVLSRASAVVVAGVVLGLAASYWATSLVSTLTYGVEARDVKNLASSAAVLAAIGAVAAWLPARRAARVDPARVLREG